MVLYTYIHTYMCIYMLYINSRKSFKGKTKYSEKHSIFLKTTSDPKQSEVYITNILTWIYLLKYFTIFNWHVIILPIYEAQCEIWKHIICNDQTRV